jgi:MFS family permease
MKKLIFLPTLLLGWLFILYQYSIRLSDSVIIDRLMHTLHIGPGQIGVLSSAYYLPYVIMQIPAGLLMDRYGVRRTWSFAILFIAAGCFIFGHASGTFEASIGRALMGIGSAFSWIGIVSVIHRCVDKKHGALLIGISMSLCMVGAIIGQAPWLYLTNLLDSWREPYLYAAGFGVLVMVAVLFTADSECKNVSEQNSFAQVLQAAIPVMKMPSFWILILYLTAISLPQNAFTALWAVEFLKRNYAIKETSAATLSSLIWLGGLLGAPVMGLVSDYMVKKRNFLMAVGLLTLVLMMVVIFVQPHSLILLAILLFVIGFITNASVLVYAMAARMTDMKGTTSVLGVANMVNMGGAALVQMFTGWVLSLTMSHGNIGNFYWGLSIIPVLLLVSLLTMLWLKCETS